MFTLLVIFHWTRKLQLAHIITAFFWRLVAKTTALRISVASVLNQEGAWELNQNFAFLGNRSPDSLRLRQPIDPRWLINYRKRSIHEDQNSSYTKTSSFHFLKKARAFLSWERAGSEFEEDVPTEWFRVWRKDGCNLWPGSLQKLWVAGSLLPDAEMSYLEQRSPLYSGNVTEPGLSSVIKVRTLHLLCNLV